MPKRTKELITRDIVARFRDVQDAVFIGFGGITADESVQLRAVLRDKGARMSVLKNSLAARGFKELGVDVPGTCFEGPTAIVYGDVDAITTSKAIADWSKKNNKKFPFKGGLIEGQAIAAAEAEQLTNMPSVTELKQMIVSLVASPMTGFLGVTQSVLAGVPGVLNAIAEKKKEEGE